MVGTALLNIESVSKYHLDADDRNVSILEDVMLVIHPAEILALIGPSGSGKSTLLRLLNRLEDPDSGQIDFFGQNLNQYNPLELRRQIGLVSQQPFMFPGTVRHNLEFAFTVGGESMPAAVEIDNVLRICAVDPSWLNQSARKLSVGQQQRVSLARTLLNRPKLLLLDEPTSSLDPETADQILIRLTDYIRHSESSMLMVSHDHQLVAKFADRTLVLQNGTLTAKKRSVKHAES